MANQALLLSLTLPFFKEGFSFLLIGGLTTQEVINNDQDAVSDRNGSSFGPSTFADPAIVLCQIAMLLMRSGMSGLNQQAS